MTLFQILSKGQRILVHASEPSYETEECIYTWNRSLTLQCWRPANLNDKGFDYGEWVEVDAQTLFSQPKNFEEANKAAETWAELREYRSGCFSVSLRA